MDGHRRVQIQYCHMRHYLKSVKRPIIAFTLLIGIAFAQQKPPASSPSPGSEGPAEPVFRVGGDVRAPRLISGSQPDYPRQARKGHQPDPIVISMVVGSDGQTRDVMVNVGISPELDQAAVEAVKKWQFDPATRRGKPVAVRISTEFDFQP